MHLYNLLLMMLADFKSDGEEFIRQDDTSVFGTQTVEA